MISSNLNDTDKTPLLKLPLKKMTEKKCLLDSHEDSITSQQFAFGKNVFLSDRIGGN